MTYLGVLQRTALRHLRCPDFRLALHPRFRGRPEALKEGWRAAFQSLPAGTCELECHPGFTEAGFSETDNWSGRREVEFRFLTDPDVRRAIEENGIERISYADLDCLAGEAA
jgi:predicted glycoside hydrolase/deacetylase ChbG (UPF0249 family)